MNYNLDLSETKSRLRRNYRQQHNLDKPKAVWGDAFGVVADPNRPGKVYVRQVTSNGLSAARSVWAPRILFGVEVGDPVKLKYDDGRLMVDGPDHAAMLSVGTNPVARAQRDGSAAITQVDVQTLAVIPSNPPSLSVSIKSWNPVIGNTAYQFPGAVVGPLTAPSTGEMYYACLFVKSDYATTEVTYSTARPVTDPPLDLTDIQECLTAKSSGSTPVFAIKLIGGQTAITKDDLKNDGVPLQQLVNTAESDPTSGITLLARVPNVNMNTATATTLYTVPTGRSCLITHVVVRNASASLTTASYSFGFNSASFDDVIANATHAELTGATLYTALLAKAGAKVGVAADLFKVLMNTLQGGAATTTIDVFGVLF